MSPDTAARAPTREGGKVGKGTLTRVCRTNDPAPIGGQLGHRLWSLPCPQHLLLSWGPGVLSASPRETVDTGGQPRMGACPDAEALERLACMGQKPARGRCTHPPPRRGASEGGISPRCRHCLAGPAALPQPLSELSPPSQAASARQGGTLPPAPGLPCSGSLCPGIPVCSKHRPLPLLWASRCDPGCLCSLVPGRRRKQSHSLCGCLSWPRSQAHKPGPFPLGPGRGLTWPRPLCCYGGYGYPL